jgi:hypothetical protein
MNIMSKWRIAAVVLAVLMLVAGVFFTVGISTGWFQVI